jgi:hypothetical protein
LLRYVVVVVGGRVVVVVGIVVVVARISMVVVDDNVVLVVASLPVVASDEERSNVTAFGAGCPHALPTSSAPVARRSPRRPESFIQTRFLNRRRRPIGALSLNTYRRIKR